MSNFKGTKKLHKVEFAGVIFILDKPLYEGKNILDYDAVGKEVAEANAKLLICATEMLEMLELLITQKRNMVHPTICAEIEQLIKKATE